MLRRTMLFATLAVGIAIGSCDSPGGEGRLMGTEPATAGSRQALVAASAVTSGCVGQGSGMLRVPPAGEPCRDNETPIVLGGGLAGYEIVTEDELFGASPPSGSITVECPAGKRVLGGGAAALREQNGSNRISFISGTDFAKGSYPSSESAWTTGFVSTGGDAVGVRGFAVCAY